MFLTIRTSTANCSGRHGSWRIAKVSFPPIADIAGLKMAVAEAASIDSDHALHLSTERPRSRGFSRWPNAAVCGRRGRSQVAHLQVRRKSERIGLSAEVLAGSVVRAGSARVPKTESD